MKERVCLHWIASAVTFCCLINTNDSRAQIVPDATLPNNSRVTIQGDVNTITGGTTSASNWFHSFDQFSVGNGKTAYFDNAINRIQNIVVRVTGSSASNIDGTIQANGTANIFLLNPNGISFGTHAQLNLGGSFLASTASSLLFKDGPPFSTIDPQTTPLLSISVPIGLQFRGNAGSIFNRSKFSETDSTGAENVFGLRVQPGKTLALVGGDVVVEGGHLTAQDGRIELGSVAGNAQVSTEVTAKGWAVGYENVENFQDIHLSQGAYVDASGESSGGIHVQGKRVMLTNGSQIFIAALGAEPGGSLTVNASDLVELSGTIEVPSPVELGGTIEVPSSLFTITNATGEAGNITIQTEKLTVQKKAVVGTQATELSGRGGDLTVIAPESVEIISDSSLSTQTQGIGAAGDLTIKTGQLVVRYGGQVSASSYGQGKGGNIWIDATQAVNLTGVSLNHGYSSGLFTRAANGGEAGSITVNTHSFQVADGAVVDALTETTKKGGDVTVTTNSFAAINGGQVITTTRSDGNAGNISLNVADSINISGSDSTFAERFAKFDTRVDNEGPDSGLFANTDEESTGNGGNLTLNTRRLNIRDGGTITVSSHGLGNAGNLVINSDLVQLDRGILTAQTESGEGNITIQGGSIQLRHNSLISTEADGNGSGGNITINADTLVGLENSDIVANADYGKGGFIQITAQAVFEIERREELNLLTSDITAFSEQNPQLNGAIEINTPDTNPSQGLVNLPVQPINVSGLIAQGCPAGGGQVASQFVVTGRGGLPDNPSQTLSSDTIWSDLRSSPRSVAYRPSAEEAVQPTSSTTKQLVEAQGWVISSKGEVVLTAAAPSTTPHSSWITPPGCHAP